MKEKMQDLLLIIIGIGILILCFYGLSALDKHEKNRAIERCGGYNNIIEKYTNQGDTYYICKTKN